MPFCASQIVYSHKFEGQTAALSETLITSANVEIDGVYQYSATSPLGLLSYGANYIQQVFSCINGTFALKGGYPITLSSSLGFGTSFPEYNVQVVIEQLA